MSPPAQREAQIAAIVREVLARLQQAAGGGQTRASASPRDVSTEAAAAATSSEQVVPLAGPVISVATLQGVPSHIRCATIAATAVVTPAARDAARQRALRLEIAAPSSAAPAAAARLWLSDADCPRRQAATVGQLQRRGVTLAPTATVDQLVSRVLQSRGVGFLLADTPALHVCHACRHGEVRAAAVSSMEEAEAIAAAMDVNLWVVDAKRLPLTRMLMLLQHLAQRPAGASGSPTQRTTTQRAAR